MDKIAYKGYLIEPQSEELRSGGWTPKALVLLQSGGSVRTTSVYSKTNPTFSTKEEADQHAAELAKVWIDQQG